MALSHSAGHSIFLYNISKFPNILGYKWYDLNWDIEDLVSSLDPCVK